MSCGCQKLARLHYFYVLAILWQSHTCDFFYINMNISKCLFWQFCWHTEWFLVTINMYILQRNLTCTQRELTGFLLHHILFSTVVFSSINGKSAGVPLAEWRVWHVEERELLWIICIRVTMWSKCYKANRWVKQTEEMYITITFQLHWTDTGHSGKKAVKFVSNCINWLIFKPSSPIHWAINLE